MEDAHDNEASFCYICHNTKDGEELLNGICLCRGGNGYHFSCLVEHGKNKLDGVNDYKLNVLQRAWTGCSVCHRQWADDMYRRMANEFAAVVTEKYPENLEWKIEALRFKLAAAKRYNHSLTAKENIAEQENIAHELANACRDLLSDNSGVMTNSVVKGFAEAYWLLAAISLGRRDATKTLEYCANFKEFTGGSEGDDLTPQVDHIIVRAKSMMHGVDLDVP